MKKHVPGYIVSSTLLFLHILTSPFWKIIFNIKAEYKISFDKLKKDRYLFVANHQKRIDPYVIFSTLSITQMKKFMPLRTIVGNVFLKNWWQKVVMYSNGSIPANSEKHIQSGISGCLFYSDMNDSLLIFPEGKRNKNKEKLNVKPGVAYLASSRDFNIIPVFVDYRSKYTKVVWGKPFRLSRNQQNDSSQKLAEYIFNKVTSLSDKPYPYEK